MVGFPFVCFLKPGFPGWFNLRLGAPIHDRSKHRLGAVHRVGLPVDLSHIAADARAKSQTPGDFLWPFWCFDF